jgi:HD-GYP domain-containing protein (c-di-GMP phosphodiesterase class II)
MTTVGMYEHEDVLKGLDEPRPLSERLELVHDVLKERYPFVERVAVALFDAPTGALRTFADSSGAAHPLQRYEATLSEAPSIAEMLRVGRPRVVNDLAVFDDGAHAHSAVIRAQGYRSSYTLPLTLNGVLWGVLFFNSKEPDVFTPDVVAGLDVYGHLISRIATHDIAVPRMLLGALRTAIDMMYERDPETGAHLERMARFARLIAQELAVRGCHWFDDEFIERVFLFAPLHDIGKIGIPDRILRKRGRLTEAEFALMRTHAARGAQMIDRIVENFRLGSVPFVDMLRTIAELHHETLDGRGYPRGLKNGAIPIEARIVAVADVCDALASRRPYTEPWDNDEAFTELRRLADDKLDGECVEALAARRSEVELIQRQFAERETARAPVSGV